MRLSTLITLLLVTLLLVVAGSSMALEEVPGCYLDDGRVNNRAHRDCGSPIAVYMTSNEILVLAYDPSITNKPEQFIMRVARNNDIPANGNVILDQTTNPVNGRPVILSRLTTGEWQINTFFANGDGYIFAWYTGQDVDHIDPVTGKPMDGAIGIVAPGATNPGAGASAPPVEVTGDATTDAAGDAAVTSSAASVSGTSLSNCRVRAIRIVRLRTLPDTNSEVLTRLPFGTTWTATERAAGWFRVIYLNTQGWVAEEFVAPVGDC
jgi:hypothetical protein